MASAIEDARRLASQLAAEDSAPGRTARGPAFALGRLIKSSTSAPRQGGRTASAADAPGRREAFLNQLERGSRHVRSTGQSSTTAATDRAAAQQASPSPSPPPSSPAEASPQDLPQTTPRRGWSIAVLWRLARNIDLEAAAENNPTGFLGILIGLAGLIVAVLAFLWAIIQGVAALVLEARSTPAEGLMNHPAKRRIEAAWADVKRWGNDFAGAVGSLMPISSLHRTHARQWDRLR